MADIYKETLCSILGSRYKIGGKYAEGGMGKIYLGMHRALGKQVAIKVIDQRFCNDKKIRKQFFKEAKLVANLSHKGIIDIYDFGSREDFDFIIMPFIDGVTLSKKLSREGRLSMHESLRITRSVAEALAFAQKKKVVHRDIKPSNILIDEQQEVILTDFGICKDLTDPERTASRMIMGSPKYMSPEQALGQSVDGRSDLYSLGLVFYEMVTGKYPFHDKQAEDLLHSQVHGLPPEPDRLVSDIEKPVNDVIVKLIQKSPERRYQSAEELIEDLKQCAFLDPRDKLHSPIPTASDTLILSNGPTAVNVDPGTMGVPLQQSSDGPMPVIHADGSKQPETHFLRRSFHFRFLALAGLSLLLGSVLLYHFGFKVQDTALVFESTTSEKNVAAGTAGQGTIGSAQSDTVDANQNSPHAHILAQLVALGKDKDTTFVMAWSNQLHYRIGDEISYHFISEKPCYLIMLNQTSAGNIVQIFPNGNDRNQFVAAKRKYSIPREELEITFTVTGPPGRDELIVLVSGEPFALFPENYEDEVFYQLDGKNADAFSKRLDHLLTSRTASIAQKRIGYTIDN